MNNLLSRSKKAVKTKIKKVVVLINLKPVVDTNLHIPQNLCVEQSTGEGERTGKNIFRFCWQGSVSKYQLGLRDETTLKWRYVYSSQQDIAISLKYGVYRAMVRNYLDGRPRKVGQWSTPLLFAVGKDGTLTTGLQALIANNPDKTYFYENVEIIKQSIANKETVLSTKPMSISLILDGRGCNIKCIYCYHHRGDFEREFRQFPGKKQKFAAGKTIGTPQRLVDSIKELGPCLTTVMFGGGEPLVYPEFRQTLRILKDFPNVQLSVCSNFILVDDELIEIFTKAKANVQWLRISMDGATKETYEKIRVKGDFDKLISNIHRVIKARGSRPEPKIQWNFVVMKSNYKEIFLLLDLAHDLGISAVNYKILVIPKIQGLSLYDELKDEDPLQDKELCKELIDTMGQAEKKAKKLGLRFMNEAVTPSIFERYPKLAPSARRNVNGTMSKKLPNRILGSESSDKKESKAGDNNLENAGCDKDEVGLKHIDWKNVFCHMPFTTLNAGHNRAHFCCYASRSFFFDEDVTFMDLWNRPEFVKARQYMYEGRADKVCSPKCPHLSKGGVKNSSLI